jgi:type I restriction enzyme S subunit
MGYAAYGEYRTSGISWLERVPSHWDVTKFKRYCDIQLGKMLQPQPGSPADIQVPYLRAMHVQWERVDTCDLPEMWASEKEIEKFGVKSGDLLVCEGGEVGRTAILKAIDGRCIIQNALHRIRGNEKTFPPYVNYLMRHIADARWFEILCNKATIAHLTGEKLGELGLPLPIPEEQQAIARFLDFKTAQIDALIAKKKELLDKLTEKRTALISHAVTKGLNPSVSMKDSGVPWLGKIPAHWDAKRLKFVVSTFGGGTPNTGKPEYWNGGIPWVSPKDMKSDFIEATEDYLTELGVAESATKIVPVDSVLIVVRSGILRHTIPVARNTVEVSLNQDMKALVANERLRPGFIHWFISGLQEGLLPIWSKQGCTVESIEMDYMSNTVIPLPPVEEQDAILKKIQEITARLDAQAEKVTIIISSLLEYRSSLITHAVTGKIDVRGFEFPDSVEAQEPAHA